MSRLARPLWNRYLRVEANIRALHGMRRGRPVGIYVSGFALGVLAMLALGRMPESKLLAGGNR